MRPLEFNGVISRSQDVTQYKQNEDTRPAVEQTTIQHNMQKAAEIKKEQVYQKKDEDLDKNYDAKEGKGGNEYQGNGKHRKKKQEDGKVVIK